MKKICFFISNLNHAGGTERVTTMISNALDNKNYKVIILSLNEGDSPFYNLNSKIKIYSLFEKNISMKKNFLAAVVLLRKFIKNHKIDVVISVDSILCMFSVPALAFLKTKHICWEHFNFKVDLGVKYRKYGRILAAKYCDYVVTLTQRDQELWSNGIKNIKAKVIPICNPTPFENVNHIPSFEHKTILSIGRLTYQKGFDMLIDAWAMVCKVNKDWKLVIVGEGEDKGALIDKARNLSIEDRVIFVGETKNVNFYYKTSSVYCMSSRFEGLPMVLLEANSYGLPIISFDCDTGPSEIINKNFLVKCFDLNEYAEKLSKLISNRDFYENQLSQKSIKKFRLDEIIVQWEDML